MIKNILIVSDNYNLVTYFKALVEDFELQEAFEYRYSAVNKAPDSLIDLGMKSVDLKKENEVERIIQDYQLVISAHCKQIFSKKLVNSVRCINIHPGFNPYNRGWYPQVFSILNGQPIGCTIHEMNEEIDAGAVIAQKKVEIFPTDDSLKLYNRVQIAEKELLKEHLVSLIKGNYEVKEVPEPGNYNSISDFRKLCELDLDRKGTLSEHIDLLRALTHGDFNNAFFYEDGKKIFVKLTLETE